MAKFHITATYAYEGVVEADTAEEAESIFLSDLNAHYDGTDSYDCEQVCVECETEIGFCDCEEDEDE
jgi:hypothetical protein